MGGGIAQRGEDIGASTRSYVDYFEGDNDAGMDAGARKANYTDVVNKCVLCARAECHRGTPHAQRRSNARARAARHCDGARGRYTVRGGADGEWTHELACAHARSLLTARRLRYYDLATSFYEYGWCVSVVRSRRMCGWCWRDNVRTRTRGCYGTPHPALALSTCCACVRFRDALPPAGRAGAASLGGIRRAACESGRSQLHLIDASNVFSTSAGARPSTLRTATPKRLSRSPSRATSTIWRSNCSSKKAIRSVRPTLHPLFTPPFPLTRTRTQVLDVGCGVGGPLRCIAEFSGAAVTGLNNNAYQITRGEQLNAATGHHGNCRYVKGDFMDMGALGAGTFDCAYQIEATCHAPDLRGVLSQIFKSLKPGGLFASYEWCMTGRYQVGNKAHEQIKHDILLGNGLPDLYTTEEVVAALKDVGFEILEAGDLAASSEVAWYEPIDATSFVSITNFRTSRLGRAVTHAAVWALETLKVAPRGTSAVSGFLVKGADALVAGGRADLFTPMFFTLSRKPLAAAPAGPSGLTAQTGRAQAVEAGEEVERVVPRSATHSRRSAQ